MVKPIVEDDKPVKKEKLTYYRVITGSFADKKNAEAEISKLKKLGYAAFMVAAKVNNKTFYRVIANSSTDKNDANKIMNELKQKNIDSFISIYEKE